MTAEELFSLGLNRDAVLAVLARLNEEEEEREKRWDLKEEEVRRLKDELAGKDGEIRDAIVKEQSASGEREEALKKEHEEAIGRMKAERLAEFRRARIGNAAEEAGFISGLARRAAIREMEEGEEEPEKYLSRLRETEPGLFRAENGGAPVFTVPIGDEGEKETPVTPPFVYLRKPVNA